eukprot:s167_g22.t1
MGRTKENKEKKDCDDSIHSPEVYAAGALARVIFVQVTVWGRVVENSVVLEHTCFAGVLVGMPPSTSARAHDSESSGSASTFTGWVLRVNEGLGDSLADSHSGKETIRSGQSGQSGQSEQSGQSGSDEERKSPDHHEPRSSASTSAESRPSGSTSAQSRPAASTSAESRPAAVGNPVPDPVPDPVPVGVRPVGLQSPPTNPTSNQDHQNDTIPNQDHRDDPCLFHSYHESGCLKGDRCEYSHLIHADQVQAPIPKTPRGHPRNRIKRRVEFRLSNPDLYSVHHELQKEAQKDSYAKELIRRHLRRASSSHAMALSPRGYEASGGIVADVAALS